MQQTTLYQLKTESTVISGMSYVVKCGDGSIFVIDGGLMEKAQRAGYILDGWYTDPECTHRFLFSNPINDDIADVD